MQINQVCQTCKLTKKAIEYYEKKGLIQPEIAQNGYRIYNEGDIRILKEIAVLRKVGVSTQDIKSILTNNNKAAALSKCKFSMDLKLQKIIAQHTVIDHLINHYDIEQASEYLQDTVEPLFTIKEKLLQAFPGNYGIYLAIHFGPFLNEKIDHVDKEIAYQKIIEYLDRIDHFYISDELGEFMENTFSSLDKETLEQMHNSYMKITDNIEEYLENNKENVEEYLKMRSSDEFINSPAYKLQQLLLEFQQKSGYYDIFINNLKILSPSYQVYTENLNQVNEKFIEKFPQVKNS